MVEPAILDPSVAEANICEIQHCQIANHAENCLLLGALDMGDAHQFCGADYPAPWVNEFRTAERNPVRVLAGMLAAASKRSTSAPISKRTCKAP